MLDHLRLALPHEDVCAPIGAHVERFIACVQDEYLMHVPRAYQRPRPADSDRPSPSHASTRSSGFSVNPLARADRGSASHGPLDGRLLLRGERHRGRAPLDVLDVDPRVVAALDRRHDGARPGRVEERERGRLLASGVLVGVIPDDGGVGDRSVDAPVDAGQPRRRPRRPPGGDRRCGPGARRRSRPCRGMLRRAPPSGRPGARRSRRASQRERRSATTATAHAALATASAASITRARR